MDRDEERRRKNTDLTAWEWILYLGIVLLVIYGASLVFDRDQDAPPGAEIHCERSDGFLGRQEVTCEPYWP